jgi:hypothetical protein
MTIYLMNTTVIPSGCDGSWKVRSITKEDARNFCSIFSAEEIVSTIGHESTAEIMTSLLERDVEVNRIQAKPKKGDHLLCFKLLKRAPEGVILTTEQLMDLGFEWVLMTYWV